MTTTVLCTEVRPATDNNRGCVIVASRDGRHGSTEIDLADTSRFPEVKDRLRAQGLVPGGPLPPAPRSSGAGSRTSPTQLIIHDEQGKEHRLIADELEEYSLSSGSSLYYFHVAEAPLDCRWLVGRALEVAGSGCCQPDRAGSDVAANGGSETDCSLPTASPHDRHC